MPRTVLMRAFYYSTTPAFEDAEFWFGPHPTREAAATAAAARFPDVGFRTAQAEPQANELNIFTPAMATEGGPIADAFTDRNEETFGEDGEGGPRWWTEDAIAVLIKRLNYQFAAWATEHGYQRGWMLDINEEQWTPPPPRTAPVRRPVLTLFCTQERAA